MYQDLWIGALAFQGFPALCSVELHIDHKVVVGSWLWVPGLTQLTVQVQIRSAPFGTRIIDWPISFGLKFVSVRLLDQFTSFGEIERERSSPTHLTPTGVHCRHRQNGHINYVYGLFMDCNINLTTDYHLIRLQITMLFAKQWLNSIRERERERGLAQVVQNNVTEHQSSCKVRGR